MLMARAVTSNYSTILKIIISYFMIYICNRNYMNKKNNIIINYTMPAVLNKQTYACNITRLCLFSHRTQWTHYSPVPPRKWQR